MKTKILSFINEKWIPTIRNDNSGVGLTFEHLINIDENQKEEPDYHKIEIKTSRKKSKYPIGLFSCALEGEGEKVINNFIRKYGYHDKKFPKQKILNINIYSKKNEREKTRFYFKLNVDKKNKKVYIKVYNMFDELIDKSYYWTFVTIRQKLYRKCSRIALIEADNKYICGKEYFKYNKVTFYEAKDFDSFLNAIENDKVGVSLGTSTYKDGPRKGELHIHGFDFFINKKDFKEIFDEF